MSIQDSAQQIAIAIHEVVGVDVVIIDNHLQRITDTFRYQDNTLPIHSSSIIGRVIHTGQPIIVDNKYYFKSCVECKDRISCIMIGLVGVPILYEDQVIGAIGLIIDEKNSKHLIENVNLILGFLQQMADCLTSKLAVKINFENIEVLSVERDSALDALDAGVVLVNADGSVISYNQRFISLFGNQGIKSGVKLLDYVFHPLIDQALKIKASQYSQTIVILLCDTVFYGRLSSRPMWRGETFCGTVFSFLSLHTRDDQIRLEQPINACQVILRHCGEYGTKQSIKLLQQYACTTEPLLIRCSTRSWTVELANAIHKESERSGNFLILNTFGYTDREAEQKLFGQKISGVSQYTPNAMLLAHHGTLCICNIFLMPVFLQIRIRNYLKGLKIESEFHPDVRLLFSISPTMEMPNPYFIDQELYDILSNREISMPVFTENPIRLRAYLDKCAEFFSHRFEKEPVQFLPEAAILLADSYPWNNSVRQVRQAIEYLVRMTPNNMITVDQVRALLADISLKQQRSIQEIEQDEIHRLLQLGKTPDKIAEILKISRATLYRRMKKYKSK